MPAKKSEPAIDWSRPGPRSRAQINAEARGEKRALGLSGRFTRFVAHVDGETYEVPIPDVQAIRTKMGLSQAAFAKRFSLSSRTIQQWEQHRAMPDFPARILLRAIELAPDIIAKAADDVRREITASRIPARRSAKRS